MSEPSDRPKKRKPFQYGLGTLFAITTTMALFLGLARFADRPGVGLMLALILFLPLFCFEQWFMRDDKRLERLGCFLTTLLFLLGAAIIFALMALFIVVLAMAGYK